MLLLSPAPQTPRLGRRGIKTLAGACAQQGPLICWPREGRGHMQALVPERQRHRPCLFTLCRAADQPRCGTRRCSDPVAQRIPPKKPGLKLDVMPEGYQIRWPGRVTCGFASTQNSM